MIDPELESLVRASVRQALVASSDDIGRALAEFGWAELVATDDAYAHTVLFEEQGRLGVDTDALDVVTLADLGLVGHARVLWPLEGSAGDATVASNDVVAEGVALRAVGSAGQLVVPWGASLHVVDLNAIEEAPLGGMAAESAWVRVRAQGRSVADSGSWTETRRRARLAVASEIVGVSERMLAVATEQVSERRQFGRPIGTYQAIRHRLAEAYAELAGARSLVAMAWEDGRPDAASWAKTVAAAAHATIAKHTTQVCGAIGLHEEHPLPALVRRGFALDALLGAASAQRARMSGEGLGEPLPDPVGSF